ncbi:unnamed protein product [Cylicocyclus nassatus]|uniref:Phospholipid scramblase n=1 Tax=Cylicocyclus nassatus TaxID=53992 RepID=A0AA36GQ07_CYLNA|nr:unnamed protein product [Cylicocyclus nassatus]
MSEECELPFIRTQPSGSAEVTTNSLRTSTSNVESLEILSKLSGVVIQQRINVTEILTSINMANIYDIYDFTGRLLFVAYEESSCLCRCCMPSRNGFIMHIFDENSLQELIRFKRKCKFCCCCTNDCTKLCACLDCCSEMISVESPLGHKIGTVNQICGTKLKFNVCDNSGFMAQIIGPSCCCMGCCTSGFIGNVFKIYDHQEAIGTIAKKFVGICTQIFTVANVFHIRFPVDMSIEGKILLLSAIFLVDYVAFKYAS